MKRFALPCNPDLPGSGSCCTRYPTCVLKTLRIASALRATSASVVAKFDTEMRRSVESIESRYGVPPSKPFRKMVASKM
jgi:hypothetical protein